MATAVPVGPDPPAHPVHGTAGDRLGRRCPRGGRGHGDGPAAQRFLAFLALSLRERVRTFSFLWLLRSSLPPYPTTAVFEDPGDDERVVVSFSPPPTRLPRLTALARFVVVIPAGIVLQLLGLPMDLTYPLRAVVGVLGYVFLLSDDRSKATTLRG